MARNPGQAKRATAIAERLRLGIAVIHGELDQAEGEDSANSSSNTLKADTVDPRKSVFEIPNLTIPGRVFPKEKLPMDVVGDVSGRIAIIVVSKHIYNLKNWF